MRRVFFLLKKCILYKNIFILIYNFFLILSRLINDIYCDKIKIALTIEQKNKYNRCIMTKLTFIADTHHYSKTLGTAGRQYELRSGSDQKCLAETGEILDAVFEKIADSDTSAVMIAGDVTNDGEMVSHLEFREKLYKLREKKSVYIITATHDWCCDENPRRFDGDNIYHDVEVMPPDSLPEFYHDFGPDEAMSKFITHIGTCSYVVQLSDKVRLLALNDDKNADNHAGFTEEHFCWIEEQLENAERDGCLVIGMEHHLLMPHISPLVTGGSTCVANREYVASRLADAGLRYMFVGHSHIQSTAEFVSAKGNKITEINIGSVVGYPAPIVNVTVNDDLTLTYKVEHLEEFTLGASKIDAQSFLAEHAVALVHRLLDSPDKKEFIARAAALQLNGEKIGRFYLVIAPLMKFMRTATVTDVYKKLWILGLTRDIDKALVEKFGSKRLLEFVDEIMLSLFDGSVTRYCREDDYYRLVMSFIKAPKKLLRKNDILQEFASAIDAVLTGGELDNQNGTI